MPGGGKSSVGRQLARRLNRPFQDTDALIEQRVGMQIRTFFDAEGEAAFRDIEAEVVDECTRQTGLVIATGGGAVLRESNRRALHQRCQVVYLKSTPEELFRRLRNDTTRPLLQGRDPLAKLRELFTERDPLYSEVAHFTVETGRPSLATIVNLIAMQLDLAPMTAESAVPGSRPPGSTPP